MANTNNTYFHPTLFTLKELSFAGIHARNRRLAICRQPTAAITIEPKEIKMEKIQRVDYSSKKMNEGDKTNCHSKMGKGLLRQCHASIKQCLSQLIESLSNTFLQLLKLNIHTSQRFSLTFIHQHSISEASHIIQEMPISGQLNQDYNILLQGCKEIAKCMSIFRKEFGLHKQDYQLPTHSQLFSSFRE